MNTSTVTSEEKAMIRSLFGEMRKQLEPFMQERDFTLSNPQIFTFLTFCPAALAIASDGKVDETEIAAIEGITKNVNVHAMVNLDMFELMSYAPEPDNCIINEEFNIRAGTELLHLSRNMSKYNDNFIAAIKTLLKFDANPEAEKSLTQSFASLMNSIIENNVSENKEEELEKLKKLQEQIGIIQPN